MIKKLVLTLLVPFSLFFSQTINESFAEEDAVLYMARMKVCNLVETGNFSEAKSATDALIADFSVNPGMPEALYWIAERYDRVGKFDEAITLYQRIVQNYPENPMADKARLSISRAESMSMVTSQEFDRAKKAIDKMMIDFADNPDLPEAVYWTTNRFKYFDRYSDAKYLYQQISQKFPNSPWAEKARFNVATADAAILLISQDFDKARKAIEKLSVDFASNSDLPESLYWITDRYDRAGKYEDAKRNYLQIAQNFPDSPWAQKARLGFSRSEALALIASEQFDKAQNAIDKMAVDFAGNPDLPEALYWTISKFEQVNRFEELKKNYRGLIKKYPGNFWAEQARLGVSQADVISLILSGNYNAARIARNKMSVDFAQNTGLPKALYWLTERYEFANQLQEAKSVYEQIIRDHPDSPFASKAQLGIRRVDVMALMNSKDGKSAEKSLDKMIKDFKDNPELPRAVFIIGAKCLLDAKVPDYGRRALKMVERVIEQLPTTEAMAEMYEQVYCCAGDCCFDMNDNITALSYYNKLASEFPEHKLSAKAQFRIGEIYKKLAESGTVANSEAKTRIQQAYEQLLLRHPNSEYADSAKSWLYRNKLK